MKHLTTDCLVCRAYCTPNATFSAQAEPLVDLKTLAQYTDWMKGMLTVLPDARYEVKSFATDSSRNNVAAYGIFYGTHTGQGGPVPPTGRKISTDYVYIMQFDGDRIAHIGRVWTGRPWSKIVGRLNARVKRFEIGCNCVYASMLIIAAPFPPHVALHGPLSQKREVSLFVRRHYSRG